MKRAALIAYLIGASIPVAIGALAVLFDLEMRQQRRARERRIFEEREAARYAAEHEAWLQLVESYDRGES